MAVLRCNPCDNDRQAKEAEMIKALQLILILSVNHPVPGDLLSPAYPNRFSVVHIVQETGQPGSPGRMAADTAMQAYAHHLRAPFPFHPELIERILQKMEKILACSKTVWQKKSDIVRHQGIGNYQ